MFYFCYLIKRQSDEEGRKGWGLKGRVRVRMTERGIGKGGFHWVNWFSICWFIVQWSQRLGLGQAKKELCTSSRGKSILPILCYLPRQLNRELDAKHNSGDPKLVFQFEALSLHPDPLYRNPGPKLYIAKICSFIWKPESVCCGMKEGEVYYPLVHSPKWPQLAKSQELALSLPHGWQEFKCFSHKMLFRRYISR